MGVMMQEPVAPASVVSRMDKSTDSRTPLTDSL